MRLLEKWKIRAEKVIDSVWKLCNLALKTDVVPEDWRAAVIVPLYKNKGQRTKCKNYRGTSLWIMLGKIYVGILVDICEEGEICE